MSSQGSQDFQNRMNSIIWQNTAHALSIYYAQPLSKQNEMRAHQQTDAKHGLGPRNNCDDSNKKEPGHEHRLKVVLLDCEFHLILAMEGPRPWRCSVSDPCRLPVRAWPKIFGWFSTQNLMNWHDWEARIRIRKLKIEINCEAIQNLRLQPSVTFY